MRNEFNVDVSPDFFGAIPFLNERNARNLPGVLERAFTGAQIETVQMPNRALRLASCKIKIATDAPDEVRQAFSDTEQVKALLTQAGWRGTDASVLFKSPENALEVIIS